jgi:hypothetical protein
MVLKKQGSTSDRHITERQLSNKLGPERLELERDYEQLAIERLAAELEFAVLNEWLSRRRCWMG